MEPGERPLAQWPRATGNRLVSEPPIQRRFELPRPWELELVVTREKSAKATINCFSGIFKAVFHFLQEFVYLRRKG